LQFLCNIYTSVVAIAVEVNVITALLAWCGAFACYANVPADGFEGVFDGSFVCHIVYIITANHRSCGVSFVRLLQNPRQ